MDNKTHEKCKDKSGLFLVAYIVFLFICVIVHQYNDFAQWKPLVVSITISSACFESAGIIKNELNIDKYSSDIYGNSLYVLEEKVKSLTSIEAEKMKKEIRFEKMKNRRHKATGWFLIMHSNIITFIGIVFLLCNSVFGTYDATLSENIDVVTILSFALILSARVFGDVKSKTEVIAKERITELEDRVNNLIKENSTEATNNAD